MIYLAEHLSEIGERDIRSMKQLRRRWFRGFAARRERKRNEEAAAVDTEMVRRLYRTVLLELNAASKVLAQRDPKALHAYDREAMDSALLVFPLLCALLLGMRGAEWNESFGGDVNFTAGLFFVHARNKRSRYLPIGLLEEIQAAFDLAMEWQAARNANFGQHAPGENDPICLVPVRHPNGCLTSPIQLVRFGTPRIRLALQRFYRKWFRRGDLWTASREGERVACRLPFSQYRTAYVTVFSEIINDPEALKAMAGHSDAVTTLSSYKAHPAQVLRSRQAKALNGRGAEVRQAMSGRVATEGEVVWAAALGTLRDGVFCQRESEGRGCQDSRVDCRCCPHLRIDPRTRDLHVSAGEEDLAEARRLRELGSRSAAIDREIMAAVSYAVVEKIDAWQMAAGG